MDELGHCREIVQDSRMRQGFRCCRFKGTRVIRGRVMCTRHANEDDARRERKAKAAKAVTP